MRAMYRYLRNTVLLAAALVLTSVVRAQALSTASKSADISIFAGVNRADPDYGPKSHYGTSFGVNYTRYFHLPVAPSIEVRANIDNGPTVNEHTYLGGLRVQAIDLRPKVLRRVHPYADFLIGPGKIQYNVPTNSPGYTHDSATVYNYGAGANIEIVRNFQAKADFQYQSWTLDSHDTLTPTLFTIGVTYIIPFRFLNRQSDYRR